MKILKLFNKYGHYENFLSLNCSPITFYRRNINLINFKRSSPLFARSFSSNPMARPVVIGGSNIDFVISALEKIQPDGRYLPGTFNQCCGGVGRNIADALGRLETNPLFITAIGCDNLGNFMYERIKYMDTRGVRKINMQSTACVSIIIDADKDCKLIIGNLDIHSSISLEWIKKFESDIAHSGFVVIDGNISVESIDYILSICSSRNIPVWFEPTDVAIVEVIFKTKMWKNISYISPNFNELKKMCSFITGKKYSDLNPSTLDDLIKTSIHLAKHINIKVLMVTLGKYGLLMITENDVKHFEALPVDKIKNTSGAGDCVVAGYVAAYLQNFDENQKVAAGLSCARQSLCSSTPVPVKMKLDIPKVNFKIIS